MLSVFWRFAKHERFSLTLSFDSQLIPYHGGAYLLLAKIAGLLNNLDVSSQFLGNRGHRMLSADLRSKILVWRWMKATKSSLQRGER
jgi:hypothetical protein